MPTETDPPLARETLAMPASQQTALMHSVVGWAQGFPETDLREARRFWQEEGRQYIAVLRREAPVGEPGATRASTLPLRCDHEAAPRFLGKVTTAARGVVIDGCCGRWQEIFRRGLEAGTARIALPERFLPFASQLAAGDARSERFERDPHRLRPAARAAPAPGLSDDRVLRGRGVGREVAGDGGGDKGA